MRVQSGREHGGNVDLLLAGREWLQRWPPGHQPPPGRRRLDVAGNLHRRYVTLFINSVTYRVHGAAPTAAAACSGNLHTTEVNTYVG
jgi:hypothetical protein